MATQKIWLTHATIESMKFITRRQNLWNSLLSNALVNISAQLSEVLRAGAGGDRLVEVAESRKVVL